MVRKAASIEPIGKPHPGRKLTEKEFVEWCDEETRAEWVDGEVILIAPDNTYHNQIAGFFYKLIDAFASERVPGRVFFESIQLRLPGQRRRRQPDVIFVSERQSDIIRETYIDGAPDLIIEVVSPDSRLRDYREKLSEYEAAGVREYWIIDPLAGNLEVYALARNRHYVRLVEKAGKFESKVVPGFYLRPEWLWSDPLPNVFKLLKEMGIKL
ncbi:MAG TPA: Uma2 family endonuclease [Planctomycetota bacterium]|nr:Uma2 family endonuclease [Planctomycetota bacterium]